MSMGMLNHIATVVNGGVFDKSIPPITNRNPAIVITAHIHRVALLFFASL